MKIYGSSLYSLPPDSQITLHPLNLSLGECNRFLLDGFVDWATLWRIIL